MEKVVSIRYPVVSVAWRLMRTGGSGPTTLNKVWSVEFSGDDFSVFRLT